MATELFDAMVANPGRLSILTSLAVEERQDFVRLRERTHLTDGNLACHARRLASAGLIGIDKSFRDGKPVTQLSLTPQGRAALEGHARRVLAAISHRRVSIGPAVADVTPEPMESAPEARRERLVPVAVGNSSSDEWID